MIQHLTINIWVLNKESLYSHSTCFLLDLINNIPQHYYLLPSRCGCGGLYSNYKLVTMVTNYIVIPWKLTSVLPRRCGWGGLYSNYKLVTMVTNYIVIPWKLTSVLPRRCGWGGLFNATCNSVRKVSSSMLLVITLPIRSLTV